MNHVRRFEDKWYGKLASLWPVIVAFGLLGANYVKNDQKIIEMASLSKETADRVASLEQKDASKQAFMVDIKEQQQEMSRDIKEILRRLR